MVFLAGGLKAQEGDARFQQELDDSTAVALQIQPEAKVQGSPLFSQMETINRQLVAAGSPILKSPEQTIITVCMAAEALGQDSSGTVGETAPGALGWQSFVAVKKRHPDLYGLTSEFSTRFWDNAWYVRHHEPEEVFILTPDGDAIARSIRDLHPQYAAQWPLVCMALVEKNVGRELKPRRMPVKAPELPLAQKMKNIIFPTVSCMGASIDELVDYLRIKSKDLDPEHVGVNVVLRPGGSPSRAQISLEMKSVPMNEALRYITELAGMTYQVTATAVVVGPRK